MSLPGWKLAEIEPSKLSLDAANARLPIEVRKRSQPSIILDMVEHEDVLELAEAISKHGYFPGEHLVAVEEGGDTIVVEGNRRLTACKLLLDPNLAPDGYREKFKNLSALANRNTFSRLPVEIAPDREATLPILVSRHTARLMAHWNPIMQSVFYKRLLDGGKTVSQVADLFNVDRSAIIKAQRRLALYELAKQARMSSEVRLVVENPREFSITTLERFAFEYKEGRLFLQISPGADGTVDFLSTKKETLRGLSRVVADIVGETLTSRSINDEKGIKAYIASIPKEDIPQKGKGKPLLDAKPEKRRRRKAGAPLIAKEYDCPVKNDKIRSVFEELQRLNVDEYPHATSILLRSLIEMSSDFYLSATNKNRQMLRDVEKESRSKRKGRPFDPERISLSQRISWIVGELAATPNGTTLSKAFKKLPDTSSEFIKGINLNIHSFVFTIDAGQIRNVWQNFQEYLRQVWLAK